MYISTYITKLTILPSMGDFLERILLQLLRKFNNANLGDATEVFINPVDNGGNNLEIFFRDVDNTDSAVKFNMKVTKIGDESKFVTFKSTSVFTETTFDGVTSST